jgi:hypothetical protein
LIATRATETKPGIGGEGAMLDAGTVVDAQAHSSRHIKQIRSSGQTAQRQ